ncbi:MAG: hypothetical protein PUK76_12980, partial [Treponema sp.]|nr:hypothetical protein [Treponema sp.]MDD7612112.1 hypothetical protein [Spirochaetales bacterium]
MNHVKSYRKKSCESYENLTQNKTSKIRVTGDKNGINDERTEFGNKRNCCTIQKCEEKRKET